MPDHNEISQALNQERMRSRHKDHKERSKNILVADQQAMAQDSMSDDNLIVEEYNDENTPLRIVKDPGEIADNFNI